VNFGDSRLFERESMVAWFLTSDEQTGSNPIIFFPTTQAESGFAQNCLLYLWHSRRLNYIDDDTGDVVLLGIII